MRTVIPLSGGLDSATVLAACIAGGDECLAIGFDYNQPHKIELSCAVRLARHFDVPFEIVPLPSMPNTDDVVFAGRNMVFASIAVSIAQYRKFGCVTFGCNASDWARFPDCRPEFWRNLGRCAEVYGVSVATPLIYMSKRDVAEAARKLNVPIELTWSCYAPQSGEPCGGCLACQTRNEALAA